MFTQKGGRSELLAEDNTGFFSVENVGKRDLDDECNTDIELLKSSYWGKKSRIHLCVQLHVDCLSGWKCFHRIDCLQVKNYEKAH